MFKIFIVTLSILFTTYSYGSVCSQNKVKLQVLGSGGPELDDGRNSSGYLVWVNDKAVLLIDAGPGTSIAYGSASAKFEDLEAILFTHFHVDHSLDFTALIKGSFFSNRVRDLKVFGPDGNSLMPSATAFLEKTIGKNGAHPYLNSYLGNKGRAKYKVVAENISLKQKKHSSYSLSKDMKVTATAVDHGNIAAVAWRIDIYDCSVVFTGDSTNRNQVLSKFAKNANIMVASNSVPETASKRAMGLHMPPSQIALISKEANVKKLVLSHFMKRTLLTQNENLKIIKKNFNGEVVLANDGMLIEIP